MMNLVVGASNMPYRHICPYKYIDCLYMLIIPFLLFEILVRNLELLDNGNAYTWRILAHTFLYFFLFNF